AEECGQVESAERSPEDQVEGGSRDHGVGIRDCRDRAAADEDAVAIERIAGRRVVPRDELVEEDLIVPKVVPEAEIQDVGTVDEDQLRLNGNLGRADIEVLDEVLNFIDPVPRVGYDERVGR